MEEEEDPFAEKAPPKPVWQAAEEGNLEEVKLALHNKQDINQPNPITLHSPLLIALKTNNAEMANFLLSKGADAKAADVHGDTALHWAAYKGDVEMVKTLISRGANVNAIGEFRNTPLHYACSANHYKIVSVLLQEGASVKHRNDYGNTPFLMSVDSSIRRMVKTVMVGGEAGRQQVKAEAHVLEEAENEAKYQEELKQQELEFKLRGQENYDRARREAILAEERRIEEEDAAKARAEEEERLRQEEARIEAERLEAERIKAEKKQKKYEKWLAKMKKKNPGFVDPKAAKKKK